MAPQDGCPAAALLDEIGRCPDATEQAYTDGTLTIIDDLAARLVPLDPRSARVKTLGVLAGMVGTLQPSCPLADPPIAGPDSACPRTSVGFSDYKQIIVLVQ